MEGKVCIQCNEFKPITAFKVSFAGQNAKMGFTQNTNYKHRCQTCYALRERIRNKLTFIAMYGGQCSCCGESDPRFLTLDHVKGDGGEHRKELFDQQIVSLAIRDFQPDRFQVLCFNCNCGRSANGGVCPHKDITLEEYASYVTILLQEARRKHVVHNPAGLALGPKVQHEKSVDKKFNQLLSTLSPEAVAKVTAILKKE